MFAQIRLKIAASHKFPFFGTRAVGCRTGRRKAIGRIPIQCPGKIRARQECAWMTRPTREDEHNAQTLSVCPE
jgi:hypothetical protein